MSTPASRRFDDPVWDLRDVIGWVLDRDPAKFGRLMSVEDVRSAESIARRYTSQPRPERDPNATRTVLHALQRGELPAHDGDTVLLREYWGGRAERDLRDAIGRGLWFWRENVLSLWPYGSHLPAPEMATSKLPPLRGAALDDALDEWARFQWGEDLTKLPNRAALLMLARMVPEFRNVTQHDIRDLRRRLAPDEIKRGGGGMHRRSKPVT